MLRIQFMNSDIYIYTNKVILSVIKALLDIFIFFHVKIKKKVNIKYN